MNNKYPTRLKNIPILESVFEIRFKAENNFPVIIPGILFEKLSGTKKILNVPSLPIELINNDINLHGIPQFALEWNNFKILGNMYFIGLSFPAPYTNWSEFKKSICEMLNILSSSKLITMIERYSIKYIDFFNYSEHNKTDLLNLKIFLHDNDVVKNNFIFQVELPQNDYLTSLKIATSAKLTQNNNTQQGIMIETDTLFIKKTISLNEFVENFEDHANHIHKINKETFFDTLSPNFLNELGAEYE